MTAALADELTRHKQAYIQLFRSVLAKRPVDAAAKEQLLQKLSSHMDSVIRTPDDLIPRIPEFASMLGVNAAQLSTFIGTNFLQALQMVSKQQTQAAAAPKPTGKPSSFLVEIVQFHLPALPSGARFETADTGYLKMITPQGEIMSQSFLLSGEGGDVQISYDAAPAAPAASSAPPAPGSPAPAPSAAMQQPRPPAQGEKSILKEILERFGNHLDIAEKLVPKDLGDDTAEVEIYDGASEQEEEAEEASPQAAAPSAAPRPAPAGAPARKESSILREILDKFGSQLDIHEKLVPKDLGDASAEDDIFGSQEAEEEEQEEAPAQVVQETVAFPFTAYLDVLKKLQEFQASGDQNGYRAWLAGEASNEAKILVAVRNYEKKEKSGGAVNWDDEYYNLSTRLNCKPAYVSLVHKHIGKLAAVHSLWNHLMQAARTAPAPQMEDLKRLWPQIRLLFDEGGTEAALNSRLQILLLAVPDPARKTALQQILVPYLKKLSGL